MRKTVFLFVMILTVLLAINANASAFRDTMDLFCNDMDLDYLFTVSIVKLPQFSEARTNQLNQLIKHFSFKGAIKDDLSSATVYLDEKPLFSVNELHDDNTLFSFVSPDLVHNYYLETNDPSENTLPWLNRAANPLTKNIDYWLFLDSFSSVFELLPLSFPESAVSTKIDAQKFRDYGTAVRKVSLSLSGEQICSFIQEHTDLFSHIHIFFNPFYCIYKNKQSFNLYYTEDNQLIRIVYSGKAEINETDLRNVQIEWKRIRNTSFEKDEFKLQTPNSKNTKRNNINLTYIWNQVSDSSESVQWKAESDQLEDGLRTRLITEASFKISDGNISGKMSERSISKNMNSSTEGLFISSIPFEEQCNGTLEINHKSDKIEKDRMIFHFGLSRGHSGLGSTSFPESEKLTKEEYSSLLEKLYAQIIKELLNLPDEDIGFLKEGIENELLNEKHDQGNN